MVEKRWEIMYFNLFFDIGLWRELLVSSEYLSNRSTKMEPKKSLRTVFEIRTVLNLSL